MEQRSVQPEMTSVVNPGQSHRLAFFEQLVLEVDGLKTEIRRLKEVMSEAKTKEKAAQDECKRLEKEIKDFKNNKDSKLKEIKVGLQHF
jgi:outer membrane murein-binding lipoprotein Lpp